MKCYLEVISAPTSDTPGTLLVLHYDDRRYLIGNLSEGSSRASLQHGTALRKVSDVFLTGRTQWANMGGMLGMMLGLADMKKAAADAQAEQEELKNQTRKGNGTNAHSKHSKHDSSDRMIDAASPGSLLFLRLHGPPNLNYAIATARRFIFRTGLPIEAVEHWSSSETPVAEHADIPPTWTDDHLQVWSMSIAPRTASPTRPSSRKRFFDEMREGARNGGTEADSVSKRVVKQMFDSDWRMDKFFPKALKDVEMPATIFMRDAATGRLVQYAGPMPGSGKKLPDIDVLVRQPWPAALTEALPPAKPSSESVCYILRNPPIRGKFMPQKAKELEVQPPSLWSKLAQGHSVPNIHGVEITPDMVLEPGKQGGGVAIVELPTPEYVSPLISRPEWRTHSVMNGVGAIVWILGPGVALDPELRSFQSEFADLNHIVSSPDVREDGLVLETAVKSAWRHNSTEPSVYPKLVVDSRHLTNIPECGSIHLASHVVVAQRGLVQNIEPTLELDTGAVVQYIKADEVTSMAHQEHETIITEAPDLVNEPISNAAATTSSPEVAWHAQYPYSNVEIAALGTGSSHPSPHRNVSSTLVRIPNHGSYLYDCGEGTLGSLRRMYTKPQLDGLFRDLRMIWISHMHADHHLGTTSVIRAWYESVHRSKPGAGSISGSQLNDDGPYLAVISDEPMLHWLREFSAIEDFGFSRILPLATQPTRSATDPKNATPTLLRLATSSDSVSSDNFPTSRYLQYIGLTDVKTVLVPHCRGAQAITCTFLIPASSSEHQLPLTSPEHVFKLSYSGDTRPSRPFTFIGRDSHVLIHEATFDDDMRVEAIAKKHSTAGEALTVAKAMNAKLVILTHFSQRYPKISGMGGGSVGGQGGARKLREMDTELNAQPRSDGDTPPDVPMSEADTHEQPQPMAMESDVATDAMSTNASSDEPGTDATSTAAHITALDGTQASDTTLTGIPSIPTIETTKTDLTTQPLPAGSTPTTDPLASQPWSNPTSYARHAPSRSYPPDLSDKYAALMQHPGGLQAAIADAGIKVVPAFDYMQLKLGDFDKAVHVQPMLRALEEFAEREKEREKEKARFESEEKKREAKEKKVRLRKEREEAARTDARKAREENGGGKGKKNKKVQGKVVG